MEKIRLVKVAPGIFWVEVPDADLRIVCGCPADSVKHLIRGGFISPVEKNGRSCETGPNAILLSDVPLQKGRFANLAEFPVLQMFYFQGMLIPGHPNNTGEKPILIGIEDQLKSQMEYIFRGNYGLVTEEEITRTGISGTAAAEMMRMKKRFAFDHFMKIDDLFSVIITDGESREVKNGVVIERKDLNVYLISCEGESVTVDLNLGDGEEYSPTYTMGRHSLEREHFSVVHTGEGDGWDINRPCMSSIIMYRGKIYLIDAGPNLLHTLECMGIGVTEIEGLFHTHSHDDHFNGLTILMRTDHRIKYYATPLVRASVTKKLCALMSFGEDHFQRFFEVHDLAFDDWNDVDGLLVRPVFSPHPVETSIFHFRVADGDAVRTYAHFADIVSLRLLKEMVTHDSLQSGVSPEFYETVRREYLLPADVKKIDIGGGMIHGDADDFRGDGSSKLLLSHSARPLSGKQKEIGTVASFGDVDVLVPAREDYLRRQSLDLLLAFFPDVPPEELEGLIDAPVTAFSPGDTIIRAGEIIQSIYLLLTGVAEFKFMEGTAYNKTTAGTLMGEVPGLLREPSTITFRSFSDVKALGMPVDSYREFLGRNDLYISALENMEARGFLAGTWLFGERLSCPVRSRIARAMTLLSVRAGAEIDTQKKPGLILFTEGRAEMYSGKDRIGLIEAGGFFGEEQLFEAEKKMRARALTDVKAFVVPWAAIEDIPIVQWKLIEVLERRRRMI